MQPSDELLWLECGAVVDGIELSRMCGLSPAELDELVEYGSLKAPAGGGFQADLVPPLRQAVRLRALFDLDLFTAGLLFQYLHRIEELEGELRALRTVGPGHGADRDGPAVWREPRA